MDMGINSHIQVVGCDSTNTNIGGRGGIIQYIEKALGRPLQWFVCLLHTNELPLRHLFQTLDGPTTGANTFSGPIGQAIKSCELLPVVKFQPISLGEELPALSTEVIADLSRDQQYLYNIVQAIRSGTVSDDFAQQKPGPLNHSRWLTLSNRVCRLYVAESKPDANLEMITHFIVTNYAPNWFSIKCQPTCIQGPKHVYRSIQCMKFLPTNVSSIVQPYIARNAYFAHPENILLAMMADADEHKRKKATAVVMKVKEHEHETHTRSKVRRFVVPPINFQAKDWDELINWEVVSITEPPLTLSNTAEQIMAINDTPMVVPDYANNTQSVERCIKLVTDAAKAVCGNEARDGFITARVASRTRMPIFDTKEQFAMVM